MRYSWLTGLLRWCSGKESVWQCRKHMRCGFSPWSGSFPGGGSGNPLQYSRLENSMGKKSLVGCNPECHKELDTTEWMSTHSWLASNVVMVSGEQWRDSVIHIHVFILLQTRLRSKLPYNTEQSSLCYTVGHCWLFILNIAECTRQSQTPWQP